MSPIAKVCLCSQNNSLNKSMSQVFGEWERANPCEQLGTFFRFYIYKWKNHFSEMKGDVGMSLHEKEGEQEDA